MRAWFFHPLFFYPVVAILALVLVAISLRPQAWPRPAETVAGEIADGGLTIAGEAFTAPEADPEQRMTVVRDDWGRAESLRIAVLPNQGEPAASDRGVRILLETGAAAAISGGPVTVEVTYNPLPVNAATGLAVSVQGADATSWSAQPLPPQPGTVHFQLPGTADVRAIGLRAISDGQNEAYGLEITRIRVARLAGGATAN